jgi:arylamine N-acetyltransferase
MAARANPDGTRCVLENQTFTHRRASDGHVLKTIEITTSEELLDILETYFRLHFTRQTRFGIFDL